MQANKTGRSRLKVVCTMYATRKLGVEVLVVHDGKRNLGHILRVVKLRDGVGDGVCVDGLVVRGHKGEETQAFFYVLPRGGRFDRLATLSTPFKARPLERALPVGNVSLFAEENVYVSHFVLRRGNDPGS